MNVTIDQPGIVRIDGDQCYWVGVIPPKQQPRSYRARQQMLAYLAEPLLPVPLDELILRFTVIPDGTALGCAVQRTVLDELDETPLVLTPSHCPETLGGDLGETTVDTLNLLTGDDAPPVVRTWSRRLIREITLIIVILAAILVMGAQRRIAAYQDAADRARQARHDLIRASLPSTPANPVNPQQIRTTQLTSRLTVALRQAEASAQSDKHSASLHNAGATLGSLLASWREAHPREAQVETINVTPEMITIHVLVPTAPDAQALGNQLRVTSDWQLQPLQIETLGDRVRTSIRFISDMETTP